MKRKGNPYKFDNLVISPTTVWKHPIYICDQYQWNSSRCCDLWCFKNGSQTHKRGITMIPKHIFFRANKAQARYRPSLIEITSNPRASLQELKRRGSNMLKSPHHAPSRLDIHGAFAQVWDKTYFAQESQICWNNSMHVTTRTHVCAPTVVYRVLLWWDTSFLFQCMWCYYSQQTMKHWHIS